MANPSVQHVDGQSEEEQPTEPEPDPLFEGETLRISPQYLRRFLAWLAERRDWRV